MITNKKIIGVIVSLISLFSISSVVGKYYFTKSSNISLNGTTNIANNFEFADVILKAGNEDTSCTVKDKNGNDISQDEIKNFFVENDDVEDMYGNHFVQLKKYYVNMSQDSNGVMTYRLSKTKIDDTYFVCPYFKDKDGKEINYAYYGKYKGKEVDGKLCSKTGLSPTYSVSVDTFRTYAQANGDQYHQTDWCAVFTSQIMYMCFYKTTGNKLTYRDNNSLTGSGTQFLGIEDIVTNGCEYIDGIVFNGNGALNECSVSWADKISDYKGSNVTTHNTILTDAHSTTFYGGEIKEMYYEDGKPALSIFPKLLTGDDGDDYVSYYCAAFYWDNDSSIGNPEVCAYGNADDENGGGVFGLDCDSNWDYTAPSFGSRLHTKKLALSMTLKAGYEDTSCSVTTANGDEASQDYSKIFFVNNEDVEDTYGNHFVELNKYYINMSQDSDGVITYKLANVKIDDTYFVCPYFKDKDGNEIDYAYYGKYKGSVTDGKLCSKAGVIPTYSTTIDDFRTYARANGDQYHQTDWCTVFTAQIMYMCFNKETNSNHISTGDRPRSMKTGTSNELFLGIEDIIGNGYEFADGIAVYNNSYKLKKKAVCWCDYINDYSENITTHETTLQNAIADDGYSYGTIVNKYYVDNGSLALSLFPKNLSTKASSGADGYKDSVYYCDQFSYSTDSNGKSSCVLWGSMGGLSSEGAESGGIFHIDCSQVWSYLHAGFTTRLHTKKLASSITLKAGYEDASCSVTTANGNEASQDYVENFFVNNEDVEDTYGNHFVELNKYYINMSQDSDGVITYKLANMKIDDTYFICPYFKDKDGNEINYAYYGKYKGNVTNGKLCSKAGVIPTYSTTIDDFRTYARANGDQYHQTDWCTVFTAQIMFMCYYKTTKADDKITYRSYGGSIGSGTQVLGIEDIIGNGLEVVDGVCFYSASSLSSCAVAYDEKISDYKATTTTNKTTLTGASGSSGKYISKMYYVNGKPALSIFPKALSGSSSTYYCDSFFYLTSSSTASLISWGADGSYGIYGLFCLSCEYSWSRTSGDFGSRLHCKILDRGL